MFMPGGFEFYEVKIFFFVIIFQKENGNTFTFLIIFIVKSLHKEQNSTNLLLWPPIFRNKPAITPKGFNSLDTNSNSPAFSLVFIKFLLNYFDRLWYSLLLFTRTALGPDGRASAVLLQLLTELPDKICLWKIISTFLKQNFP